jgi:hypothetical protein
VQAICAFSPLNDSFTVSHAWEIEAQFLAGFPSRQGAGPGGGT